METRSHPLRVVFGNAKASLTVEGPPGPVGEAGRGTFVVDVRFGDAVEAARALEGLLS